MIKLSKIFFTVAFLIGITLFFCSCAETKNADSQQAGIGAGGHGAGGHGGYGGTGGR